MKKLIALAVIFIFNSCSNGSYFGTWNHNHKGRGRGNVGYHSRGMGRHIRRNKFIEIDPVVLEDRELYANTRTYGLLSDSLNTKFLGMSPTNTKQILNSRAMAPDLNQCENDETDKNPAECRKRQCFYCCYDRLCHVSKQSARDCFDRKDYCDALCDDAYTCRLYGCAYDHNEMRCYGKKGNGITGFNYCGETTIIGGIEFEGVSKESLAATGKTCLPPRFRRVNCLGTPEEAKLFIDEVYVGAELEFEYYIPQDGQYQIALYFCDPRGHPREMDISMNKKFVRFIKFQQRLTPPFTAAEVVRIDFTVAEYVSLIKIHGVLNGEAMIDNNRIKLSLLTKRPLGQGSPVLSAVYMQKLT